MKTRWVISPLFGLAVGDLVTIVDKKTGTSYQARIVAVDDRKRMVRYKVAPVSPEVR